MTVVLCIGQTPHSAFGAPFGSMLDRDPVQLLGGFVTRLLPRHGISRILFAFGLE